MNKQLKNLFVLGALVLAAWSCQDDDGDESDMDDTVAVTSVALDASTRQLLPGEEFTLTATITPTNATNKGLDWSSSDLQVVTVDANGGVKATGRGTATITAETQDGGKTATCLVTVITRYVFNNVTRDIQTAVYGNYPSGYQFWLYPTVEDDGIFDGASEFIRIDIPREMMDSTFTLTEENPYDWDWRVKYRNSATKVTYEGAGFPDGIGDVDSGTLYAVMLGDDAFEVHFDVLFTDGKRLTGKYAGTLVKNNGFYGDARRGNF
jgi:hypothetical protein